ncbi:MAG: NAD(P)H-dependent oxidoreductase subunit E [Chloroflexota bacterium]|nr:NAD(P)H-dependent oxidoreductase subunit E [Anaerolineae bacterium]
MSPKVVATETQRTRLLTALYIVQEQYGYLSDEAIQRVSERLDMHPQEVYSMASFYSLYKTRPTGKYVLQVCEGLSCYLADGADRLIDYLREKLAIEVGQTTSDDLFTLQTIPCLAACGSSPAMRVNDTLHENLTVERVDALIERLRGD